MPLDADYEERAVYVVGGEIDVAGDKFGPRGCWCSARATGSRSAPQPSRISVIGGATLDGPRHVWWNFVSSRKERIEQAKDDWRAGKFAAVPGDEIEFIPLPERYGAT